MALIACPDCGKEMSDAAPACPNCGRPMAGAATPVQVVAPQKGTSCAAMGCLVLLVLLAIGWCSSLTSTQAPRPAAATGGAAVPAVAPTPVPETGGWQVSTDKSSMDDSQTVTLSLAGAPPFTDWLSRKHSPTLIIRCKERKTEIYVTTGTPANPELGNYNQATTRLRVDDGKPFAVNASESTDKEALFLGGAGTVKRLLGHERLLFQFTPFKMSPQEASFPIKGIDKATAPLRKACGW